MAERRTNTQLPTQTDGQTMNLTVLYKICYMTIMLSSCNIGGFSVRLLSDSTLLDIFTEPKKKVSQSRS